MERELPAIPGMSHVESDKAIQRPPSRVRPSSSPTGSVLSQLSRSSKETSTSNRSRFSFLVPGILNRASWQNIIPQNMTTAAQPKKQSNLVGNWLQPKSKPKAEEIKLVEGLVKSTLTPPFRFIRKVEYANRHGDVAPHLASCYQPQGVDPERLNMINDFLKKEQDYFNLIADFQMTLDRVVQKHESLREGIVPILQALKGFCQTSKNAIFSAKTNHLNCGIADITARIKFEYQDYAKNFKDFYSALRDARRDYEDVEVEISNPKEMLLKPLERLVEYRFYLYRLRALYPEKELPQGFIYPDWWLTVRAAVHDLSPTVKAIYELFNIKDTFDDIVQRQDYIDTTRCRSIDPVPENQRKENPFTLYLFLALPLPDDDKELPVSPKFIDSFSMFLVHNTRGRHKLYSTNKHGKLTVSKRLSGEEVLLHIFSDMFMITTPAVRKDNKWCLLYPPMPMSHGEIVCNSYDQVEGDFILIEVKLSPYKMVVAKVAKPVFEKLCKLCHVNMHASAALKPMRRSYRKSRVTISAQNIKQSSLMELSLNQEKDDKVTTTPILDNEDASVEGKKSQEVIEPRQRALNLSPIDLPQIESDDPRVIARIESFVDRVKATRSDEDKPSVIFEHTSKPRTLNTRTKEWTTLAPCIIRIYQKNWNEAWVSIDIHKTYKNIYSCILNPQAKVELSQKRSAKFSAPDSDGNAVIYLIQFENRDLAREFVEVVKRVLRQDVLVSLKSRPELLVLDPPVQLSSSRCVHPELNLYCPYIEQALPENKDPETRFSNLSFKASCQIIRDCGEKTIHACGEVEVMVVTARGPPPVFMPYTRLIVQTSSSLFTILNLELEQTRLVFTQERSLVRIKVRERGELMFELAFVDLPTAETFVQLVGKEFLCAETRREVSLSIYQQKQKESLATDEVIPEKDRIESQCINQENEDADVKSDDKSESHEKENAEHSSTTPEIGMIESKETRIVLGGMPSESTLAEDNQVSLGAMKEMTFQTLPKSPVPPQKPGKPTTFRRSRVLRESTPLTETKLRQMKRSLDEMKQFRRNAQSENEALMAQLRVLVADQHKLRVAECELKKLAKRASSCGTDMI